MDFVSLQSPSIWVDTRKLNIFAKVVSAIFAEETMTARNARFDGHSIALMSTLAHGFQDVSSLPTGLEVIDTLANSNHYTSSFMSNDTIALENQSSNASCLPKVNIRPSQSLESIRSLNRQGWFVTYPQIPVALI